MKDRKRQVDLSAVLRKTIGRRDQPSGVTMVSSSMLRPSERTICDELVEAEGRPSSGRRKFFDQVRPASLEMRTYGRLAGWPKAVHCDQISVSLFMKSSGPSSAMLSPAPSCGGKVRPLCSCRASLSQVLPRSCERAETSVEPPRITTLWFRLSTLP